MQWKLPYKAISSCIKAENDGSGIKMWNGYGRFCRDGWLLCEDMEFLIMVVIGGRNKAVGLSPKNVSGPIKH